MPQDSQKSGFGTGQSVPEAIAELNAKAGSGQPLTIADLIVLMAVLRNKEHGCPWDVEQDFASIAPYTIEEAYEVADAIARGDLHDLKDELGDLLFAATNLARHLGLDAEAALRRANTKFERRFRRVESSLATRGRELHDADLAEMEAAWQAAKAEEK